MKTPKDTRRTQKHTKDTRYTRDKSKDARYTRDKSKDARHTQDKSKDTRRTQKAMPETMPRAGAGSPSGIKAAKSRRARRRKIQLIRITLFALLCLCGCFLLVSGARAVISAGTRLVRDHKAESLKKNASDKPKKSSDTPHVEVKELVINTNQPVLANEPVTLTISSIGDCTLGTDANFARSTSLNAFYDMHGPDYFFQNVRSVLEADDLTIVNMEGTLTESNQRQNKTYAFKGPPEYAAILSGSSVEAANLANNHSKDYGEQSYADTVKTLEEAGIPTFGFDQVKILDIKGVKVGLTGIYELADHLGKKKQVKDNIAALKEAGAQLIIVNFHWGMEREYTPNDTQKTLAHLAIDEGADLVIGHHPHVLQGIEKYKDKYIAYSLGNFCFGGNSNPADKDTIIFQQTFTVKNGVVEKDDAVNIIPCSISSVTKYNDYCPTVLDGEEKQRILDKIEEHSQW